jgi:carbonic anhydrase
VKTDMRVLDGLFEKNLTWADEIKRKDPQFFEKLSRQQAPEYLWIGCSDSRVPANEIVGLLPGELFVHRNVANIVMHTDLNCLSVIPYAVEVLQVKHIIVCGHYGCGGVKAAMEPKEFGLIDYWLRGIKDIHQRYQARLANMESDEERVNVLCELNVIEQVASVARTTIVQNAWKRGQDLTVHGWIYSIKDGVLRDLDVCLSSEDQLPDIYRLEEKFVPEG